MNLTRRDFAKVGVGGLLAFLLPGKAKGKVKPKATMTLPAANDGLRYRILPKFPRFFVPVTDVPEKGPWLLRGKNMGLIEVRGQNDVVVYARSDTTGQIVPAVQGYPYRWSPLCLCECDRWVKSGDLREITAAEAKALLAPNRVVRSPKWYLHEYERRFPGIPVNGKRNLWGVGD